MPALLSDGVMAREKPRTESVKLPADVIRSARIVSAYRDESMAEMLAGILRPVLAEMEREEAAKRLKVEGPAPKRGPGPAPKR
jgi:hypothetical protein